jgi:hypothetical protein
LEGGDLVAKKKVVQEECISPIDALIESNKKMLEAVGKAIASIDKAIESIDKIISSEAQ